MEFNKNLNNKKSNELKVLQKKNKPSFIEITIPANLNSLAKD